MTVKVKGRNILINRQASQDVVEFFKLNPFTAITTEEGCLIPVKKGKLLFRGKYGKEYDFLLCYHQIAAKALYGTSPYYFLNDIKYQASHLYQPTLLSTTLLSIRMENIARNSERTHCQKVGICSKSLFPPCIIPMSCLDLLIYRNPEVVDYVKSRYSC